MRHLNAKALIQQLQELGWKDGANLHLLC